MLHAKIFAPAIFDKASVSITISFPERKLFTRCSNKKGRTVFLVERIARELPQKRRRTGVSVSTNGTNGGPVPSVGTHYFEIDYRTASRCAPAVPAKMGIAVVFSSLSFGEKQLVKYAYVTLTTRLGRSVVIKVAHIFEGSGLAMVGGAGGLYVAIGLMRMQTELFRNEWTVLLMMLYGAFGFYVGIDLPNRVAHTVRFQRPEEWSFGADAAALASAAGTLFVALAVFLSVSMIVLDETVHDRVRVLVGCCWAIGTSFQIAAGAMGRSTLAGPTHE